MIRSTRYLQESAESSQLQAEQESGERTRAITDAPTLDVCTTTHTVAHTDAENVNEIMLAQYIGIAWLSSTQQDQMLPVCKRSSTRQAGRN